MSENILLDDYNNYHDKQINAIAGRNYRIVLSEDKKTRVYKPLTVDELIDIAKRHKKIIIDKSDPLYKKILLNDLLIAGY